MYGRAINSVRIGRVIYNDGLDKNTPKPIEDLIRLILEGDSVKSVEVWLGEDQEDRNFGLQVLDDGMYLTAFFGLKTGFLRGDWF